MTTEFVRRGADVKQGPTITDLPTPPPLAPAQTGQRRSNLVRDTKTGKIVKNDRKDNHGR